MGKEADGASSGKGIFFYPLDYFLNITPTIADSFINFFLRD
jgi:hypothetical protein